MKSAKPKEKVSNQFLSVEFCHVPHLQETKSFAGQK